jgi:RNA polymerase sigma-70 factor (ECF subfamily)
LAEDQAGSEIERARREAEERALVDSARKGSRTAFEALYRRHVGNVYGLCLRMTAHRATAEDCTQEAFIQAWRSLPAFEGRSAFGTWLHRIAVNAVLAQGRRRGELLGVDGSVEDEAVALPDHSTGSDDVRLDIEAAVAGLPAGARQVLVLVGLYGHSHEEAAAMLGIAPGTCKSQLHRARRLLAAQLGTEEGRDGDRR